MILSDEAEATLLTSETCRLYRRSKDQAFQTFYRRPTCKEVEYNYRHQYLQL